jgi:hypothetical protein
LQLEREGVVLAAMRTKPGVNFYNMLSHVVFRTSEYRLAAMYSEPEVQLFLKQLKQINKLKYVITPKE